MFNKVKLDLQPIRDYAQAVEREASIKPIRGRYDVKPLAQRRNLSIRIQKQGDDIVCVHHSTGVVTFKPDGDIVVRIDGWASQTTATLISTILGADFYIFDKQMWCMAAYDNPETLMHFPISLHGETTFRRPGKAGCYRLQIVNPIRLKAHKINRRGSNNVRARYADFIAYADRTFRLRAINERGMAKFSSTEFEDVFGKNESGITRLPKALWVSDYYNLDPKHYANFQVLIDRYGDEDKTQDYYKALLWLVLGIDNYRTGGWATVYDVYRALDEVLKLIHREEMFTEVDAFGLQKRDTHGKFFRQRRDQSS